MRTENGKNVSSLLPCTLTPSPSILIPLFNPQSQIRNPQF